MRDFLCSLIIEVAISAGALFLYNAYPIHMLFEGKSRDDPHVHKDLKFWIKGSLYYFTVLLALSFPLKYFLKYKMCPSN